MGFRIHASPNPQPISLIKDDCWDDVVKELLGEQYSYYNVWFNTSGNKLSTEGIKFLLNKLIESKKDIDTNKYNLVITFLKQAIDNNNYLESY